MRRALARTTKAGIESTLRQVKERIWTLRGHVGVGLADRSSLMLARVSPA